MSSNTKNMQKEAVLIFQTPAEYYAWVDSEAAKESTPEEFATAVVELQKGIILRQCEYNPGGGVSCDCEPEG